MHSEIGSRKWFWGGVALQFATGFTAAYLVYQVGSLITSGTVGRGFLPGLAAVAVIVAVITGLIYKANKNQKATYAFTVRKNYG